MKTAPLTIHMRPEEREAINRIAEERSSSLGSVIRMALKKYVEDYERAQAWSANATRPETNPHSFR